MKYVLGCWLETCDDDTGGFGPRGGIGELLMLLGTEKKRMETKQSYSTCSERHSKVKLRNYAQNIKSIDLKKVRA